jgi:hypothetical protein
MGGSATPASGAGRARMTWAAPLWLFGLLPWSAVVLYLLWGRRRRTDVPFLELWQVPAAGVRVRRRVSPPPLALALALVAALLAVLAAGGPEVPWPWGGSNVSLVVDRGYTMSARGQAVGTSRTSDAVALVEAALGRAAMVDRIDRRVVPGVGPGRQDDSDADVSAVRSPTAVDTRDALQVATRAALSRGEGPVIVLSDQPTGLRDARVIEVPPDGAVRNARVVSVAARETPGVQVMVRVRGGPGLGPATVRVTSGGASAEREVDLAAGREVDAFLDLPRLGDVVKAELLVGDDQPADDAAWLVRESSWPRLEPRFPLAAHVGRVVDVYARRRPAGESSRRVVLVRDARDLPAGEPGVVLPPADVAPPAGDGAGAAGPEVRDHPVTRGVAWADVDPPAVVRGGPPAGWTPVVSAGGKVWVAVREQPIRGVWIGFDTTDWARSAEFVIFWANVFTWAGAGGERFASYPVGSLDGAWQAVELAGAAAPPEPGLWPGLYGRADGTLRALHAPDVPFPPLRETGWRAKLARVARDARGRLALAPVLALLALACLLAAAAAWKPRPRAGPMPSRGAT